MLKVSASALARGPAFGVGAGQRTQRFPNGSSVLCLFTCPRCVFLCQGILQAFPGGQLSSAVPSVLGRTFHKASPAQLPPNLANSPPGNSQELFQMLHPGFLVHWWPFPFRALPPCWIQCPVLLSLRLISHGHPSSGAPVALQCCPRKQSQAPGPISGCIVKFILAIKAPLFS